jgi:alkanesulfonate monooxygenase SsuD/methylene tetrahydromethanopterin reductase-like flavin-dependent oxidoreductase (luciferase family)
VLAHEDDYKSLLELNAKQAIAIEILNQGGSHQEAADAAGVHRVTVSKWVSDHPAVKSEMYRRVIARAREMTAKSGEISVKALSLIQEAIEDGDRQAAFKWLGMTKHFFPAEVQSNPYGPETMSPIEMLNETARKDANNQLGNFIIDGQVSKTGHSVKQFLEPKGLEESL